MAAVDQSPPPPSPETPPPSRVQLIAASAVAAVFFLVSLWLLYEFGKVWDHAVVVYNAICSIAFTAFGVLLGSKVQEVNVAKATSAAMEAKSASDSKSTAIKQALGSIDKAKSGLDEAGGGMRGSFDGLAEARAILLSSLK